MAENQENLEQDDIFTLVDEEGKQTDFMVIDSIVKNEKTYFAMIPVNEEDKIFAEEDGNTFEEYIILRVDADENGENVLNTIDDDGEFESVADEFDQRLAEDIDYDAEN